MTRNDPDRRVRIHPTDAGFIGGVRAVERLVPADVAEVLIAHEPAAFSREKPDGADLDPAPLEDLDDIYATFPHLDPDRPGEPATAPAAAEGGEEVSNG